MTECADIEVLRPGLVPYREAWAWQQARAEALRPSDVLTPSPSTGEGGGGVPSEALAVLQHPPVYTLGMRGRTASMLASNAEVAARGGEVVQSDRGGDVTFHGPGQLVAYPILDVRARGLGPASYVRLLEACIIDTLAAFGIEAERVSGRPGVWARERDGALAKIAAVGVRIRHGVSTHGLALNVSIDLAWFEAIVPCGIADAGVTSMARLLAAPPPHDAVEDAFLASFERAFGVQARPTLNQTRGANGFTSADGDPHEGWSGERSINRPEAEPERMFHVKQHTTAGSEAR